MEGNMTQQSKQVEHHSNDSDLSKGAIEGGADGQGNTNAPGALGDDGLPQDEVAIAEDVLGANEDGTQG
jgi:hypothetical protein